MTSKCKPTVSVAILISFIIIPAFILSFMFFNNTKNYDCEETTIATTTITTTKATTTEKHHNEQTTKLSKITSTSKHLTSTTAHSATPYTTTKKVKQTTSVAIKNETNAVNVHYKDSDITMIAKVLYNECRGISSKTQKACVVWVICNRVDNGYGSMISSVVLQNNQFAYNSSSPVNSDLYNLAKDVLERWSREKNGETNVGRVLPRNYLYFHGDGKINYFKTNYTQPYKVWDYSLPSPYNN